MGLDGLVGGFFLFFLIACVVSSIVGMLFAILREKVQKASNEKKAKEKHEANLRYQAQFGQNEEHKTKWRQNEKYNDFLTHSIAVIRSIANEEEKRILYSDKKMSPYRSVHISFRDTCVFCSTCESGDNCYSTVFSTSYEGYNISDEQRSALLRALKEDIEKEIPKLIFYFKDFELSISVANYQHYLEKKDIF